MVASLHLVEKQQKEAKKEVVIDSCLQMVTTPKSLSNSQIQI